MDSPAPRHYLRIVIGGVLVVAVLVLAWLSWQFLTPHPPGGLVAAQKQFGFPLYYAKKLPEGFGFDEKSISTTKDVALYAYAYENGKKRIVITVQPRPAGYDTSKVNSTTQFTATIGRVYLMDLEDRTGAIIITDKAWVIMNAPDKIPEDDLRTFTDSLRPLTD